MQGSISQIVSGVGISISAQATRTADGGSGREIAVPKGNAGTLSTRTDNETGTLTLGDGHTITSGTTIDLYWSGGARYGITVGTVSVNSVPIGADNSGSGDNLPTQSTPIIASARVEFNADIDGDELEFIALQMHYPSLPAETAVSHLSLLDAESDEIEAMDLYANAARIIDVAAGDANTLTGDPIVSGTISNASSAGDAVLKAIWLQDSTT